MLLLKMRILHFYVFRGSLFIFSVWGFIFEFFVFCLSWGRSFCLIWLGKKIVFSVASHSLDFVGCILMVSPTLFVFKGGVRKGVFRSVKLISH